MQDDVCRPAVVEQAIALALEELEPARQDDTASVRLERELAARASESERLADAIGRGGAA